MRPDVKSGRNTRKIKYMDETLDQGIVVDNGEVRHGDSPSFVSALTTAIAFEAITRSGKDGRPSWIDRQQEKVLRIVAGLQVKFGLAEKFKIMLPTPERLEEAVSYWERQFAQLMPESFPHFGLHEINTEVERRAGQYMAGVIAGAEFKEDEVTIAEKAVARNLFMAYSSGVEVEELKRILVGSANATCQDIADADVRALLSTHVKEIRDRWANLRIQKPNRFFATDLVTAKVMGRALSADVVATTWNVSPAGIELMSADKKRGFTISTIPWESIVVATEEKAGEPGRIRLIVKLPDFVKKLNTFAGGLFRQAFQKLSKVGGEVVMDIIGEEDDAGLIVVRDPKRVKDLLVRMKTAHNSMAETLGLLDKILNEPEPKRPYSPRPSVVVEELVRVARNWRENQEKRLTEVEGELEKTGYMGVQMAIGAELERTQGDAPILREGNSVAVLRRLREIEADLVQKTPDLVAQREAILRVNPDELERALVF